MLGSRVRAPEGVQSKRLIINDYRSFCFLYLYPIIRHFRAGKRAFSGKCLTLCLTLNRLVKLVCAKQCKQMNISISAVFRKDRLNSQNAAPVHLRLTQNRKLKHISTGVTLNINEWDFENQRVKGQTPELQALQLRIDTKSTNSAAKSNAWKH